MDTKELGNLLSLAHLLVSLFLPILFKSGSFVISKKMGMLITARFVKGEIVASMGLDAKGETA